MNWNAYYYNLNAKEIAVFNVFDHGGFKTDVDRALKKCKTQEELAAEIKQSLFYYFCSKYEWEIVLSPFTSSTDKPEIKIDVYTQVMNNWDHFINYIWSHKKQRKSSKTKTEE